MRRPFPQTRTAMIAADPQQLRALNLGEFIDGKAQQKLPKSLAAHEAEMSHFADLCHRLCMKILELFAMGLKVCCRTPTGWRYLPLTKMSLDRSQRGRQGVVLLPTRSLRGTFRHDPKIPARKGSDPERSIPTRLLLP